MLYPPTADGGVVVVTHDRRLVAAGGAANADETERREGDEEEEEGNGDVRARARADARTVGRIAGGALKAFDSLAPHKDTLKADGRGMDSAVGANAKAGGGLPWGDLFDAPSHSLPPLTTLAPHFLDALLDHQSI